MKQDGFYRYERRVGSFARSISLPEGVTDDSISASYANGVLEVRVQQARGNEAPPHRDRRVDGAPKTIEGTATEA